MTEKEAKARSKEKIDQIASLMKGLSITQIIKTKMGRDGYIEDLIIWVDNEKYDIEKDIAPAESDITGVTTEKHE